MNDVAVVTHNMDALERMAQAVAKSGLFGMKTAEQALALMLVAQAEGVHPATATQDYDIIQGRAARKTNSVLARFQQSGGTIQWNELSDQEATATFAHPQGGSLRVTWTLQNAKNAELTGKDNWKKYPRAMLRARCIAEGVRAVYPAAIGGMLVSEEAHDLPPVPEKDMGPATVVQMPRSKSTQAAEPATIDQDPEHQRPADLQAPPDTTPATEGAIKIVRKKMEQAGVTDEQFAEKFGYTVDALPACDVNAILGWLRERAG